MQPIRRWLAVVALAALPPATPTLGQPAPAQATKPGIERLYILNCGEGVAGDISRWSPGVNVGKSMDFVDSCYLIKHAQGWLLWDTGLADAIAAMPEGQRPADPRSDSLAAAQDAGVAARATRRETGRHQVRAVSRTPIPITSAT